MIINDFATFVIFVQLYIYIFEVISFFYTENRLRESWLKVIQLVKISRPEPQSTDPNANVHPHPITQRDPLSMAWKQ